MGTVMSVFVIAILQSGSRVAAVVDPNVGLVPFTLAVLSVPVFDTLRVMSTRMLKGSSPFRPDKTHLHHMFIEMGCSHVATTLAILGLNTAVVLCWWAFEAAGFSIAVRTVCGRRHGSSGHVRVVSFSCSGISAATRNSWALFAGWVTRLISAVPDFFSGCSRSWIRFDFLFATLYVRDAFL